MSDTCPVRSLGISSSRCATLGIYANRGTLSFTERVCVDPHDLLCA